MAGAPFGDLIDRIRIRLLHVLCAYQLRGRVFCLI